jgi:hypothetical protein
MKEITKAKFINTWASEWDERTGWKVSEEYHKQFSEQLEYLINQEAEKRIKERMPSEMTLEEAEIAAKETDYACFAVEPEGNEINFADAAAFYLEGWNACRSRLTNPRDSQKTEGGTK